jgi:hypothetical protein
MSEVTGQRRAPALQAFLDAFAAQAGIKADFIEASDHPGSCACAICFDWWVEMGNDEEGYGPFDPAIAKAEQAKRGIVPFDPTPFMDTDMLMGG